MHIPAVAQTTQSAWAKKLKTGKCYINAWGIIHERMHHSQHAATDFWLASN